MAADGGAPGMELPGPTSVPSPSIVIGHVRAERHGASYRASVIDSFLPVMGDIEQFRQPNAA